jgi:hypothetical protein
MTERITALLTRATVSQRMLLTPAPTLDARMLGALGRGLVVHPVDLHGFTFLSNRIDLFVTAPSRARLTGFLSYLYKHLANAVRDTYGWADTLFAGRTTRWPVYTAAAAHERLRDVHAMAVWRGWTARPEEWPGLSSARPLLEGRALAGAWDGRPIDVPLAALPPALGGRISVASMFDDLAAAGRRLGGGRPPRGREWILGRDPWRPDPTDPFYGTRWEQEELMRAAALAEEQLPAQNRLLN